CAMFGSVPLPSRVCTHRTTDTLWPMPLDPTDQPIPDLPPRQSFLGSVNVVMLTYALDGVLALATSALIARALGPGGRGAYGLFVVSAAFLQMLLGLGI